MILGDGYEERERFAFFGFEFTATPADQRRVVAKVKRSNEYAMWHAADTMARQTYVTADDLQALDVQHKLVVAAAERLAAAEQKLMLVVAKAIDDLSGQRAG
jgi:hypothetical protein